MPTPSVVALIACHDRRPLTLRCLSALRSSAPDARVDAIIVDDGSSDGTGDAVRQAYPWCQVIRADGLRFWAGAMAIAGTEALQGNWDYHLWLNDDVVLDPGALSSLIREARESGGIVVGSTRDPKTGTRSYGGLRRIDGFNLLRLEPVFPSETVRLPCDTFQGNVVLVPRDQALRLGPPDPAFDGFQGISDTDYGFRARGMGIPVHVAPGWAGTCIPNSSPRAWRNPEHSLAQRLKAIRSSRGIAAPCMGLFLRRHCGPIRGRLLTLTLTAGAVLGAFSPRRRLGTRPVHVLWTEAVVPEYRLPLIAALAAREEISLLCLHGQEGRRGVRQTRAPIPAPEMSARNIYWPVWRDRILWSAVLREALSGRHDVVLMGEHIFTLSNWVLLMARRILGRPHLVAKGHFHFDRPGPFLPLGLSRFLRRLLARGMDGLACYTESGARNCREAGIPKDRIFVFNNTLAPPPVLAGDIADIKDRAARERKRLGLGQAPVFLFIGRLYSEKRCALAAEAIALIHSSKGHPPHEHRPVLLVIGEGEDRPALERARDAGLPLVLAGEITDPVALAPLFHLSTALLAPDSLGLAIVQAFTAGLPVIVGPGRHHGPEIDYLCPGENGMIASHMTAAALAERAGLLLEDPDLLDRLRLGARTTAERLDMEVSVSVITRALLYGAGG